MQKKLPKVLAICLLTSALAAVTANPALAQSTEPEGEANSMPKVGDMAPDFSLKYFDGNNLKDVSLSQYRGKKNVVVAFFIFAFTGG
jgi:multidrug efflux pump subunit AcrB